MNLLISVISDLILVFTSLLTTGRDLIKYYSLNWGQLIVYGGVIYVLAKILKVKISISKGAK